MNHQRGAIVVVLGGTKVPRGGLTRSALNRASQIATRGYSTHLFTFDYRPDFADHVTDLRAQGLLHRDVNFHNFYDSLQHHSRCIDNSSTYVSPSKTDLIEQVENDRFSRFFSQSGELVFSELRGDLRSLWRRYYTDFRIEKRRIEYSLKGTLHRETVFLHDSPKVAWYSYLTGCGAAYFIQWVDDSGKPVDVFVADSRDSNAYIRYSSLSDAQENWFHSEVAEIGAPVTVMLDDCTMASVVKNLTSTGVRKIAIYHNDHTTEAHRAMNDAMSSWDVVICSTPGQAKALRKIVPQELRVTSIFQPIPDAVQDLSGSSREADKFAFFGRLTSVKNVIPLVRSFTEVLKCLPGASLDIYGEGPLEVELRKVISDLQLRGNVRLMGHTDEATVRMRDYAAIILPSSFEAFGLVIGEAMLNETPVIAFDSDYGPREIITHGVDGVLVPPSDFSALAKSVVQLGMDPEFARRMGKEGRRNVLRRFNSDVIMAEWEKLVDDLYRNGGHL